MSGAWDALNFDVGDMNYDGTITVSETNLGANNGTISETIPAAEAVVYVWET
jgi:surface antigen